ncbi:acyl-binding protein [Nannochloropsis oceanica]
MVVTTKLRSAFTRAAKWVKEHHKEANVANSVLFRLYGLYKRSTAGACNVRVPTILVEPIARERYNSWKLASGLSEEQAMREYLDLVRISFPAFAKAAASELKDLDDLKSVKEENRALLEETTEVLALYSKLQQDSIVKRGHLYKWHAEQVGFGGSKWQRRYLILQGTSLRVYSTAEAAAPIKTIPLQGCVVRTERGETRRFQGGRSSRSRAQEDPQATTTGLPATQAHGRVDAERLFLPPALRRHLHHHHPRGTSGRGRRGDGREGGGKKVEERAHKLDPNLFPPSMSMHKLTRPSVLSIEYPSRDYTGYLNLAMIILGVHFSHAVVDCVSLVWRYGVQVRKGGKEEGGKEGGREGGKEGGRKDDPWFLIAFLKLVSWSHTNWDLRHAFFSRRARKSQAHLPAAALHEDGYNNAKPLESGATRPTTHARQRFDCGHSPRSPFVSSS